MLLATSAPRWSAKPAIARRPTRVLRHRAVERSAATRNRLQRSTIVRGYPVAVPADASVPLEVDGFEVAISNPGKLFFEQAGITKLDLVRYYLAVAPGALRGGRGLLPEAGTRIRSHLRAHGGARFPVRPHGG